MQPEYQLATRVDLSRYNDSGLVLSAAALCEAFARQDWAAYKENRARIMDGITALDRYAR